MAVSWITVLQSVPWSDVIANAPKVAEGAKKLFNLVARRPDAAEAVADEAVESLSPQEQTIAKLEARVAALESATADLHEQMLASSELIKTLADQNAGLVKRVELSRVLMLRMGVAGMLAIALLAGALVWHLAVAH
jgi:hypothetical protein